MKSQDVNTEHVYPKFEDTNRYTIEAAVDNYEDIFNEWDPAPFIRRDLNPALQSFLEECSRDISIKHPLAVVFTMPSLEHDLEKEAICIDDVKNQFAFKVHVLEKERVEVMHGMIRNFIIGIALLGVAVISDAQFSDNFFLDVLVQGFFIGGWVFIWEAMSIVGFKNRSLNHKIKEWKRYLDAPIVFKEMEG
ncbi:hypothetical protein KC872_01260 [Candidatus Kaiserbacteria bacterium]|nr:hypothetical protein [Candidatus Kaiserbacteria bacterium]